MEEYICGYIVSAEGPQHAQIISVDPAISFSKEDYSCHPAVIYPWWPLFLGFMLGLVIAIIGCSSNN